MITRRSLFALSFTAALHAAPKRPNIVMIYADDLGYGDLGCYGHPTIKTPNLDRMAAQGMKFTQFYSANPYCSPSRSALMTGRYPARNGMNVVLFPDSKGGLPPEEITTAVLLKQQGYSTACVGKWHLGHTPNFLPKSFGFDSYFGIPYSNDMSPATSANQNLQRRNAWPPTPLIRDAEVMESEPDQSQLTRRYTEQATTFIRKSSAAKRPFFLYLAHTMPHWPLAASAAFKGKSARGLYGDAVSELDWSVGEVLKTIEQSGEGKNTLVFFSSDNGPAPVGLEGGSAGLYRDGKGTTWEGGVREPALAWLPGRIAAGVTTSAFATTMDLFTTFSQLGGARIPADRVIDGQDISDVLFRNAEGREPLLFYYNQGPLRAVRKGAWKLHISACNVAPGVNDRRYQDLAKPLLFNVEIDPSEKFECAAKNPETVEELLSLIEKHKASFTPGRAQT
jgi:arylsulfatase